jgi:hypothetical protein
VFAFTEELDAWLRSAPPPAPAPPAAAPEPSPSAARRRIGALLLVLLAVVGAGVLAALAPPAGVARVSIHRGQLVAEDKAGARLWSYALDAIEPVLAAHKPFVAVDLDQDGRPEVVVALRHLDANRQPAETLLCFSSSGRIRWKVRLNDELQFGEGTFGPPWRAEDLSVITTPTGPRIAVAVHHDVWWPSFIATLDAAGRVDNRFIHDGWLTRLESTADGRTLIAGGFNNDRDAPVLAFLPSNQLNGHGPRPADLRYRCLNCAGPEPAKYFTFPRTEINRALGLTPLDDHLIVHGDGSVIFRVGQDRYHGNVEAVYELSTDGAVRHASVSDDYWTAHRALEREGRIAHSADDCPERTGLPVR